RHVDAARRRSLGAYFGRKWQRSETKELRILDEEAEELGIHVEREARDCLGRGAARTEAGDDASDRHFLRPTRHGFAPGTAVKARARSANPARRSSTRAWISAAGRPVRSSMPSSTVRTG